MDTNDYVSSKQRYRLERMFTMQLRGGFCFDHPYYRDHSKDLQGRSDQDSWRHFVEHGQFEGRLFRCAAAGITCKSAHEAGRHARRGCAGSAARTGWRRLASLQPQCRRSWTTLWSSHLRRQPRWIWTSRR